MKTTNEQLDVLNEELAKAQHSLVALDIKQQVMVRLNTDGDGLVFGKKAGVWGLYLSRDAVWSPILACPKKTRIEAAFRMGNLIEALLTADKVEVSEVTKALEAIKAFNAAPESTGSLED